MKLAGITKPTRIAKTKNSGPELAPKPRAGSVYEPVEAWHEKVRNTPKKPQWGLVPGPSVEIPVEVHTQLTPHERPDFAIQVRVTKAEADLFAKRCDEQLLTRTAYLRKLLQLDLQHDRPMFVDGAVKVK